MKFISHFYEIQWLTRFYFYTLTITFGNTILYLSCTLFPLYISLFSFHLFTKKYIPADFYLLTGSSFLVFTFSKPFALCHCTIRNKESKEGYFKISCKVIYQIVSCSLLHTDIQIYTTKSLCMQYFIWGLKRGWKLGNM